MNIKCRHVCKPHCGHPPCKRWFDSDFDGDGVPDTTSLFCEICRNLTWMRICMTCTLDTMTQTFMTDDESAYHRMANPGHEFMNPKLVKNNGS